MISLTNLFIKNTPRETREFISTCSSLEDLICKLVQNASQLYSFLENMRLEGNELLAAKLLVQIHPNDQQHPVVKKMETILRNQEMLNPSIDPDFSLLVEGDQPLRAHKVILALESPYFKRMMNFMEFHEDTLDCMGIGISQKAYQFVLNYLYLSDNKRKEFTSMIEKSLLIEIAKLANYWGLDTLNKQCDDELCNSIEDLSIDKDDMGNWLNQAHFLPKFVQLLKLIQTLEGAAEIATRFTREEIILLSKIVIKKDPGVLFYGPSGNGKTALARALGKTLGCAGENVQFITAPEMFNKYVGAFEKDIRKLFEPAKKDWQKYRDKSPLHVIIIHEIDAILSKRSENVLWRNSAVNQFLSVMDGPHQLHNIFVIGTTNRLDLLDEAILKPGRFGTVIEISNPDAERRRKLFKLHTSKLQEKGFLSNDVNFDTLVKKTTDWTEDQIYQLVNYAYTFSLERLIKLEGATLEELRMHPYGKVTMKDLEAAFGKMDSEKDKIPLDLFC